MIYGTLDTVSGGYLYDRRLAAGLEALGDQVEVISLPWRNYWAHLTDNAHFRLPPGLDILIQDELNHPSLIAANRTPHPYPVISLVHHLRTSERHPVLLRPVYKQVESRYLRSVDGFIFNSHTTQQAVEDLVGGTKPAVIAYPPTDRFQHNISVQEVNDRALKTPLRVIFLGNVIARKGLDVLLKAIRLCPDPIYLDVVGALDIEHGYSSNMRQLVETLDIGDKVKFHGGVADEVLVGLLRDAHVLVVPSQYEGFGIVYMEGMSFGLPAIGTTSGAAGEVIEDGVTGFLIAPNDAQDLAGKLTTLARDRATLAEMSRAALERYEQQPAWATTVLNIRNFLKQRIDEFHSKTSPQEA